MQSELIHIVVADDNQIVRRGLVTALEDFDDLKVVGIAHDGPEAINLCQTLNPHILLVDLIMPKMSGVTVIEQVRQNAAEIRCVAFSISNDIDLIEAAFRAGASMFYYKNQSLRDLVEIIRHVAR